MQLWISAVFGCHRTYLEELAAGTQSAGSTRMS